MPSNSHVPSGEDEEMAAAHFLGSSVVFDIIGTIHTHSTSCNLQHLQHHTCIQLWLIVSMLCGLRGLQVSILQNLCVSQPPTQTDSHKAKNAMNAWLRMLNPKGRGHGKASGRYLH